jgi:hypothetical protein
MMNRYIILLAIALLLIVTAFASKDQKVQLSEAETSAAADATQS